MASCKAVTSKGQCSCEEFAKAANNQGVYVVCAVEGCGHTENIHYEPSGETMKVKR